MAFSGSPTQLRIKAADRPVRCKALFPPRSLHLKIALVLIECASQPFVTFANSVLRIDRGRRRARAERGETKNHGKQSEFHMRLVKYFNS
jgi:hypothetical protein